MTFRSIVAAITLGVASASQAQLVAQDGLSVQRLLVDEDRYGGCMARLTGFNSPPGCAPSWVTFDCEGLHGSKEAARRTLEAAQIAFALEKPIYVVVETTETINGYCKAKRIDVMK